MIDWIVNKLFGWERLREAIFGEVMLYQSITKAMSEHENQQPSNLTWSEGDTWYGWTYNKTNKRYYFDDIGNTSLIALWEDQWSKEDSIENMNNSTEYQMDEVW